MASTLIKVRLWRVTADMIRGLEDQHQVEISVDGARAKLAQIGGPEDQHLSETNSGRFVHRYRSAACRCACL